MRLSGWEARLPAPNHAISEVEEDNKRSPEMAKIDKQDKTGDAVRRSGKSPFVYFEASEIVVTKAKMQAVVALYILLQSGKTETETIPKYAA